VKSKRTALGELRPSQLLYTFGIGSIVDLPFLSVIVTGLEDWPLASCKPIREDRLLEQVRKRLGPQVQGLYAPPTPEPGADSGWMRAFDDHSLVGCRWLLPALDAVPVLSDPGTHQSGALPAPHHSRTARSGAVRPRELQQVQRPGGVTGPVPVRVRGGTSRRLPWDWFVHKGKIGCYGSLELREFGVSVKRPTSGSNAVNVALSVACRTPSAARPSVTCRRAGGRRPQLRTSSRSPAAPTARQSSLALRTHGSE